MRRKSGILRARIDPVIGFSETSANACAGSLGASKILESFAEYYLDSLFPVSLESSRIPHSEERERFRIKLIMSFTSTPMHTLKQAIESRSRLDVQ